MLCRGIAFLAAVIALVPFPALARDAATLRTDIGKFITLVQEHVQKDDVTGGNTAVGDTHTLKYWEAELKKIQANIKKIFRENIDRDLENFHYDINNLTSAEEKTKLMNELKAQFESYWKSQTDKFRDIATLVPQPGHQGQQQQTLPQHMPQPGGGHQGGRGSFGQSSVAGSGLSSAPPPRRSSRRSVRLDSSEEDDIKHECKRKYRRDARKYKKCFTEKKSRALRKKKEAEKRRSRRRGH